MKTSQNYTDAQNLEATSNQNHSTTMDAIGSDLKSIKENGTILADHLKEDTKAFAQSATKEASHQMHNMKIQAGEYLKTMEKSVIDKPVQSIAIAFAAGAALSLLLGRR